MPNIVWSYAVFSGSADAIAAIKATNFNFRQLHPCPYDESDDRWYEWRVAHWGCKWSASEVRIRDGDEAGSLVVTFDTPWHPPFGLLAYLTQTYPGLRVVLDFNEEFDETAGQIVFANGRMTGEYVRPTLCKPSVLRVAALSRPWLNADVILSNTEAQGGDLEALDYLPELSDTLPSVTVDASYSEFVAMMEKAVAAVAVDMDED